MGKQVVFEELSSGAIVVPFDAGFFAAERVAIFAQKLVYYLTARYLRQKVFDELTSHLCNRVGSSWLDETLLSRALTVFNSDLASDDCLFDKAKLGPLVEIADRLWLSHSPKTFRLGLLGVYLQINRSNGNTFKFFFFQKVGKDKVADPEILKVLREVLKGDMPF